MELPPPLRDAVDAALEGISLDDLQRASQRLSDRYRAETRDGAPHLSDDIAARAYLAVRLPATYGALRTSLGAAAQLCPSFAPRSMLDAGAGPGTALFAATDCWPSLQRADLIESSPPIRRCGDELFSRTDAPPAAWLQSDLQTVAVEPQSYDLVTMSYVLDELPPRYRGALVDRLWSATTGMLVIVEPGTPPGWARILQVRRQLIDAGAHLVAPCPHHAPCPLAPPDWCHFAARVSRSRMHRRIKSADVPWEDEKFIFVAASRTKPLNARARVIAPPKSGSGTATHKLCQQDGSAAQRLWSKRDGAAYKAARRLHWGDAIMIEDSIAGEAAR